MVAGSEPTSTNALVADEPVEAIFQMNENPILPACIYIFFPPLLYPKIFPPPTYHLPTPPPPHSIARAPETSNMSELGAGELRGELGARAWSRGAVEARAGPTRERDPGKHLTFFSLVYFDCLFVELRCKKRRRRRRRQQLPSPSSSCCGAALQRSSTKKVMATTLPSPSSSSLCCKLPSSWSCVVTDETIDDRSSVAIDQPIGEQNGALS